MPLCYHCGADLLDSYICSSCGQQYCYLHIDPVVHECKLVVEFQSSRALSQGPRNNGCVLPDNREFSPEMRCWFCGEGVAEIFTCHYCNQQVCTAHFNQEAHDCPVLFPPIIPPKPSIPIPQTNPSTSIETRQTGIEPLPTNTYIEKTNEEFDDIDSYYGFEPPRPKIPDEGIIELDYRSIEGAINNFISSYIEQSDFEDQSDPLDGRVIDLVKKDPPFRDIFADLEDFVNHDVIGGLLYWLDAFRSPKSGLKFLCEKRSLDLTQITLQKLIKMQYSYLFDASFYPEFQGIDGATQEELFEKIIVKGTVQVTRRCLSDISENARQAGKHECSGFLIGTRNENGAIQSIDTYIPLTRGAENFAIIESEMYVNLMFDLLNKKETIVGFCHSHPYKGAPGYSTFDRVMHLTMVNISSLASSLIPLRSRVSQLEKLKLSTAFAFYTYPQLQYILEIIAGGFLKDIFLNDIFSYINENVNQINQVMKTFIQKSLNGETIEKSFYDDTIKNSFNKLKDKLDYLLVHNRLNRQPVKLVMLPFAGVVICPWTRDIAFIDCTHQVSLQNPEIFTNKWFYYRIKVV